MASSLKENETVRNSREPFNYEVKAHYGVISKSATGWDSYVFNQVRRMRRAGFR